MLTNFFCLASGQAFSNIYGTIFFKTLGTVNPFVMTIISQSCGLVGSLVFMALADKTGRRFFWQTFAPLAMVAMLVIGGLGTIPKPTVSQKLAIAAMLPIYSFAFLGSLAQLYVAFPLIPIHLSGNESILTSVGGLIERLSHLLKSHRHVFVTRRLWCPGVFRT